MKNSNLLILLLAAALIFTSYRWIASSTPAPATAEKSSTLNDIFTRTSIRSYSDKEVELEKVDTMLRAAMSAPTAGNKQPWRFVVINDRATLNQIADTFHTMTMAREAPLAIVLCGDTTVTFPGEARDYWVQDVSAAAENLLLAAHAMQLGAVWCGIYPQSARVVKFSQMLHLPANIIPLACVCIGYPSAHATPKDKWNPSYIHYNSWATLPQ